MPCNVCGADSGKYFLCFKCNKLKEEGKVVKCPDCGQWHYADKPCKCKGDAAQQKAKPAPATEKPATAAMAEGVCIVCGAKAPNGHLCRDCFYEMKDYKDSFDKNSRAFDMKDYYFNLRSNIYRMKTFDFIKSNCNKLMAIAYFLSELYRDSSLMDRVVNDIKEIIDAKKPKEEVKVSEEVKQKDSHKEELRRTCDGHYVKSDPEIIIDDILYENRIVHCYEKKVPIDSDEQTIKCDWFIPVTDSRHGIYIEYWGMHTKDYLQNKARKRQAYKDHDIPLIEIEKDDYRDRQGLTDRIISEINMLAKKYFHITDYLK
ncbi:MAG: hypothetical protein IJF71_04255 [Clostridia bacterium]|nr:hypothetical protein [Clostridia bacterium]